MAGGRNIDAVAEGKRLVERAPDDRRQEAFGAIARLCVAASDIACAQEMLGPFDAFLKTLPADRIERSTYGHQLLLWSFLRINLGDFPAIATAVGPSFPDGAADPVTDPLLLADLQLLAAAKAHALRDFEQSRDRTDKALAALLTLPAASDDTPRLILRALRQLVFNYDTERALRLFSAAEALLQRISEDSLLFYDYLELRVALAGHQRDLPKVARDLRLMQTKLAALQIDPAAKAFLTAQTANDLLGVETLRGDRDTIRSLLQAHPLTAAKASILARGAFADRNEFMYAVAEELARLVLGDASETGWAPLLGQAQRWTANTFAQREAAAFGQAGLGLRLLRLGQEEEGRRTVIAAAKRRLAGLQDLYRQSRFAAPLPFWTEQAFFEFSLAATFAGKEAPDYELAIGASTHLGRSLRSGPDDALAIQAVQDADERRRNAQALKTVEVHRGDWERARLAALAAHKQGDRPQAMAEAAGFLSQIQRLRRTIVTGDTAGTGVDTVASLASIRKSLQPKEALVFHVPLRGRTGRVCLRADRSFFSTQAIDETALSNDARLLRASLTAAHPPSEEADRQFPAAASLRLHEALFGGLDACLTAGTRIYLIAPDGAVEGLPPGALLKAMPPVLGDGFDLRDARWMVRDHAFVRTSSIAAFVATKRLAGTRRTSIDYLGIGDPVLAAPTPSGLSAGRLAARGSVNAASGELATLDELPETSDEVKAVATRFDPARSRSLLRERATELDFRLQPLSEVDVLHFATHGLIKEELPGLQEPSLVLTPTPGSDGFDDGLLSSSEIASLPLRARLAILSACNTARYDARVIDSGIQGLSASFAIAGVPAMVASLWPVDSLTAKELIAGLFEAALGADKAAVADALARSVRRHLDNAERPLLHPRFWAALVVVGDGSVTLDRAAPVGRPTVTALDPAEGQILAAAPLEADVIVRTPASIQRRNADGTKKWEVASGDLGAGPLAVAGDAIYAAGKETLRRLDADGKLLWSRRLSAPVLALAAASDGLLALVGPDLVRLDAAGAEKARQRIAPTVDRGTIGIRGADIVVAASLTPAGKCGTDDGVEVVFARGPTLERVAKARIEHFEVHATLPLPRGWFLAGDVRRDCYSERQAVLYAVVPDLPPDALWRDHSPFSTSARALRRSDAGIELVGIAEQAGEIFWARIDRDGFEESRDFLGTGLPLVAAGTAWSGAGGVTYGAIGSRPLWVRH